jgi:hypothetical protein
VQQRDEDAAPRAAERVAQRNGAAARVHLVIVQADQLAVCFDDGGEGLVEFPDGDVGLGEAGLREEF